MWTSLFPFRVLLSQLVFGAAFPHPPHGSPSSFRAPGFLAPPAAIAALCAELIYRAVSVRSEGLREEERVGGGVVGWRKRVLWRGLRRRESAIALAYCWSQMLYALACTLSEGYLHAILLRDAGLSESG